MFPTVARCSKASRRALTPKRGNKDFYKGTRQAFLPGGHRTGAPGKHVVRGTAKYRLDDEKVRIFVAPPLAELNNSQLKPYVDRRVNLTTAQRREIYGKLPQGGLDGRHYYKVAPRLVKPVSLDINPREPEPVSLDTNMRERDDEHNKSKIGQIGVQPHAGHNLGLAALL